MKCHTLSIQIVFEDTFLEVKGGPQWAHSIPKLMLPSLPEALLPPKIFRWIFKGRTEEDPRMNPFFVSSQERQI